ncbi:hypothetical protein DM02DRAFT_699360 [Periconia macrospinosa]|uniref:RelA/SpoT domain-containing protein n=1 Tax=Periconia macrospinosa TaxID=97972 RepID=A0A2V1DXE0_9PLEO|nr:hypothetical protein DM02DRAFT_699360 [Periconia macrospinosa]
MQKEIDKEYTPSINLLRILLGCGLKWAEYLEYTRRILNAAIKDRKIAGVVTGRLKLPDKAEAKLRKRQGFYNYQSEEDILNNLVDFVGLRIAAYFPDDQRRILRLIDEHFITIASVYFEDDKEKYSLNENVLDEVGIELVTVIQQRYEDSQDRFHQKSNFTKESHQMGTENDTGNSGFSNAAGQGPPNAHVVHDATEPRVVAHTNAQRGITTSQLPSPTKKTQNKISLDNYARRFGGYTAEHRWVILRPEERDESNVLHTRPVEIQIRSVLMDSWISINRDIQYDALTGILSPQERRILDSIKGLAQTGELLLEQLHHVNTERRKRDQSLLEAPADVTRALEEYFILEDTVPNHSTDPFTRTLLFVLLSRGINKVGDLKRWLESNNYEIYCYKSLKAFRSSFPINGSFASFILPSLFNTMERHNLQYVLNSLGVPSNYANAISFFKHILSWVGFLGQNPQYRTHLRLTNGHLPSECGYSGLTLIFCTFAWLNNDEILSRGAKREFSVDLILELLRNHDSLVEEGNLFLPFALLGGLTHHEKSYLWDENDLLSWVLKQLMNRPNDWEHGVNLFLHYSRKIILRTRQGVDIEVANMLATLHDQINHYMFEEVLDILTLHEVFGLANITKVTRETTPCSYAFWTRISQYKLPQDCKYLIEKHDMALQPWRDGSSSLAPLRGERKPTQTQTSQPKTRVSLYVLDCGKVSDRKIRKRMDALGNIDIILLQNLEDLTRLDEPEYGFRFSPLRGYHIGSLETPLKSNSCLVTLVKSGLCGISLASAKPMSLGHLWKASSIDKKEIALVCDLRIHAGGLSSPICLRIANCRPGTIIDKKLLPSEDDWTITEGQIEYVEGDEVFVFDKLLPPQKVGIVKEAEDYLSPDLLCNGSHTNTFEAPGKPERVVLFKLKEANSSEVDLDS